MSAKSLKKLSQIIAKPLSMRAMNTSDRIVISLFFRG